MAMQQLQVLMKPLKKYTAMKLKSLFSRRSKGSVSEPERHFMSLVLEIDVKGPGWHKIVSKVLSGIKDAKFQFGGHGRVEIVGKVNIPLLLKRLGKAGTKATVIYCKSGQCSSNLFPVPSAYSHDHSFYYQGNNMFYSQNYPANRNGHQGNIMYYPQGRGHGYPANRGYIYDYPYGYSRDDYGYDQYGNNGCGYGGYGGSSSHFRLPGYGNHVY